VIVVDSSAVVAMIKAEPDTHAIFEILDSSPVNLMSAGNLQETYIVLLGSGIDTAEADRAIKACEIEIQAVDASLAKLAGEAFRRYGKGAHPAGLNYGDCFAYALAKAHDAPLLYKGEDFSRTDILDARRALAAP
jgi:ribonuclease VapC